MKKYTVIMPIGLKPFPARYEISAAALLASYFKTDVEFIARSNRKTPDFMIDGLAWELKSPTGRGKNNIERQLKLSKSIIKLVLMEKSKNIVEITR